MPYSVSSATAKSPCHATNEDCFLVAPRYAIVADGMGGESCGDVASRIAVDTMARILDDSLPAAGALTPDTARGAMFAAIAAADRAVMQYADAHPDATGMGTTALILVHDACGVFVAWCGDSHCYVFHDHALLSPTKDHSYVQQLIDSHEITIEESFSHPDNNLITRYVGGGADTCLPEFAAYTPAPNDIFVLCSDGLSGYCRTADVARTIADSADADRLADRLLTLATSRGSDDDITIVAMRPRRQSWLSRLFH